MTMVLGGVMAMFWRCYGDMLAMLWRYYGDLFYDIIALLLRCSRDALYMYFNDICADPMAVF